MRVFSIPVRGLRRLALAALVVWTPIGCPGAIDHEALRAGTVETLEPFESDEAFEAWADDVRRAGGMGFSITGCADSRESPAVADDGRASEDENVTNNQEAGVDEGGIVKVSGDWIVVLRRGRLFSIRRRDAGADVLVPVGRADASAPGWTQGSWYDEMLVDGSRIVVVGFSYGAGATEIGLFRLGDDGSITHEATHFLRSNDYYSSRNYASRLVGDRLVFYVPHGLFASGERTTMPSLRSWVRDEQTTGWSEVLSRVDVYKPLLGSSYPSLHTVVQCDLAQPQFGCTARAVVGPWSRHFYVARDAVYLWLSREYWDDSEAGAVVYRMPLGDAPVAALRTRGAPIDQFSFKEASSGELRVLVGNTTNGEAMWDGESTTSTSYELLRAPADAFAASAPVAPDALYTALPAPAQTWSIHNRFVGDFLLYGAGAGWGSTGTDRRVFVVDARFQVKVDEVPLAHGIERIEALGAHAVVVGAGGANLHFTSIALDDDPHASGSFVRRHAAQGESRSHGFFFKPRADGGGTLGLPVRFEGGAWAHLVYGSAEVQLVDVGADLSLRPAGALAAGGAETQADDACRVSCVDWYGNARPIFLGDRILALLGYELVEGERVDGTVVEKRRVNFLDGTR